MNAKAYKTLVFGAIMALAAGMAHEAKAGPMDLDESLLEDDAPSSGANINEATAGSSNVALQNVNKATAPVKSPSGDVGPAPTPLTVPAPASAPAGVTAGKPASGPVTASKSEPATKAGGSSTTSPSDRLLGKMSGDLFKDMAEVDRENAMLTLELKREQLKGDIDKAKSEQRRAIMEEIEKREAIVRSRMEWDLEQQRRKQEMELAREKAELRAEQIQSAIRRAQENIHSGGMDLEAIKEQIRQEMAAAAPAMGIGGYGGVAEIPIADLPPEERFAVLEVKGVGGSLSAKVTTIDGARTFTVRPGSIMADGYKVEEVRNDHVVISKGEDLYEIGMFSGIYRTAENGGSIASRMVAPTASNPYQSSMSPSMSPMPSGSPMMVRPPMP